MNESWIKNRPDPVVSEYGSKELPVDRTVTLVSPRSHDVASQDRLTGEQLSEQAFPMFMWGEHVLWYDNSGWPRSLSFAIY